MQNGKSDEYVHGMDWGRGQFSLNDLTNYRKYQYDLVGRYVGQDILEVGSGARGFTHQIVANQEHIQRLISIEPSKTLFDLHQGNLEFPSFVHFECIDLFDVEPDRFGCFDTILFIHVLEHIENDRAALDHVFGLLKPGGHGLIEVPALPWLFSVHDEMLGHYRRYNKRMLRSIIDTDKYDIKRIWYQDPIGVLGSLIFFKLRKIKLKSDKGMQLAKSQGSLYDKWIIPLEKQIERFITFPFGLSLTAILQRRSS